MLIEKIWNTRGQSQIEYIVPTPVHLYRAEYLVDRLDILSDQAKRCSGEIVLALVNFWCKRMHFLSQMAKILFIMLYQSVRDKIIMGCVVCNLPRLCNLSQPW